MGWLLVGPPLTDLAGALTAAIVLPTTVALAALVVSISVWRRRSAAGAWIALLLVGTAANLQLIHAGHAVAYQHLIPGRFAQLEYAVATGLVAIQAALVALGLARVRLPMADWLVGRFSVPRLCALAALVVLTGAALARSPVSYGIELVAATALEVVALGNVLLAVSALPKRDLDAAADRVSAWFEAGSTLRCPTVWVLTVWVVAVTALLSVVSYQRHPHVPDELSYLLQAGYFAHGRIARPAPPVPAGFDLDLMVIRGGLWYSPFPPGWPVVLAVGSALGAPWLVNPVLAGVDVLLAHALLRRLYDGRTATLAVALLSVSPWFLFLGMSFMAHTAALAAALAAALSLVLARDRGGAAWPLAAGAAAGFLGLIRPLEGMIVGLLLGVLSLSLRGRRFRLGPSVWLTLGFAAVSLLVLPYNRYFTGDPLRFPVMAYMDAKFGPGSNALGFGPNRGAGWTGLDPLPGHGPLDVLINSALNAFQVNVELFGWATGAMVLVGAYVLSRRLGRSDWIMVAAIGAVVGFHALYWFSGGPDFGARYWFLIVVPCVALAARGLFWLADELGPRVHAAAVVLSGVALLVFVPWRAVDKYHDYRGMRPDVRALISAPSLRGSLVLVRGRRHPDFASAAAYEPWALDGAAPVIAWDRDPATRRRLLAAFPGRPVRILLGPSVTGTKYRLLPADAPPDTTDPAP